MTPILIAAALSILALDPAPVVAPPTSKPNTIAPVTVEGASGPALRDPNRVMCRTSELTGSRFQKRTCATRQQWVDIDKKNELNTNDFFRQANENAGLQRMERSSIPANGCTLCGGPGPS